MKPLATMLMLFALTATHLSAQPTGENRDFDSITQFIFFSVLEGCYEDGLSTKDIDQILMKKERQSYYHFIYACPICMPTIWALETYRAHPQRFYSLKSPASTFGEGLPDALEKQLFSENPHQRLAVINSLVKKWIELRMDDQHLNSAQRAVLQAALSQKRQQGMDCLKSFRKSEDDASPNGLSYYAPAYTDLDECAVCNGAVGKLMKLPDDKAKPANQ